MARRQYQNQKRPLIVICSEGGKKSSEYYYFRNFASRNLRIQFSTGNCTDPKGMLNNLLDYIANEDIKSEDNVRIFLVLDTDLDEERIKEIKAISQECEKNNIEIITSAPTFEIWYLMHYRAYDLVFNSSKQVKKELESKIGGYNETMNLYNTICNKTADAVKVAKNCEKQAANKYEDLLKMNPHTDIYRIIEAINEFSKLT